MRKSKFTDSQIMDSVEDDDSGFGVPDIFRELFIKTSTFYKQLRKLSENGSLKFYVINQ